MGSIDGLNVGLVRAFVGNEVLGAAEGGPIVGNSVGAPVGEVGDVLSNGLGIAESVGRFVRVGLGVGETDGNSVGGRLFVGAGVLGSADGDGDGLGDSVGLADGKGWVGAKLGLGDGLGLSVGSWLIDGDRVGDVLGQGVDGDAVGDDGFMLGTVERDGPGVRVGIPAKALGALEPEGELSCKARILEEADVDRGVAVLDS